MAMFQGPGPYQRLESDDIIVEAPLSFSGSTKRLLKATRHWNPILRTIFLVVFLPLVWAFILCWYIFWSIWLIPYRLIRRGNRKEKKRAAQHREMLNQMQYQALATQTAIAHQTAQQAVLHQQIAAQQAATPQGQGASEATQGAMQPQLPPSDPWNRRTEK